MSSRPLRPTSATAVTLGEIARGLGLAHEGDDVSVTGVALHTQAVMPGDVFVALQGVNRHGSEMVDEALAQGAVAVFTDVAGCSALGATATPAVVAENPRQLLGALSALVYGTAQENHPPVFSVTGTNGKTSTAFLLEALLRGIGRRTALSTTAERRVDGVAYPSSLTTPEAPDIHAMLALSREKGVGGVAIEVSAQALVKNRLQGVMSAVVGFTNLSHDHFEDFGGMEPYLQAKANLFQPAMARRGVICVDGEWGRALAQQVTIPFTTVAGHTRGPSEWSYEVLPEPSETSRWHLRGPAGESLELRAPIIGEHMVANASLAVVMLKESGIPLEDISAAMGPGTTGIPVLIPGRVEKVSGTSGPSVFLDAGRSADAYEHTLAAIRALTTGKIVMVCGTSGNRDATKRPVMGAVAARGAEVVIVTDDDPRKEDPGLIRAGLLEGARSVRHRDVHDIPDPTTAIRFALTLVGEGDSVLWSGPGSQSYRDVGGEKVPYSAKREAQNALADAGWPEVAEERGP